jgi:uncharacterized protein
MNLWIIFLTGLTTGGLTCVAVQGGLLASAVANREESSTSKHFTLVPVFAFITFKLIAYTLLGLVLGLFGSLFQLTLELRIIFQTFAALYMLATAANLLNLHPIFRYVVIQPPKFIYKRLRNMSKAKDVFAPGLLGFLTILLPCGTTIAMEVLAISSGNAFIGASIMATFVLGTIPFFLIIGFSAMKLGDVFRDKFFKVAAVFVLVLGIWSLDGVLNLIGSPITLETISKEVTSTLMINPNTVVSTSKNTAASQHHTIAVNGRGYEPDSVTVESGKPVKLTFVTNNNYSCSSSFVFPKFGISKQFPATGNTDVEFTPTEKGTFTWTCGMGMYRGTLNVI